MSPIARAFNSFAKNNLAIQESDVMGERFGGPAGWRRWVDAAALIRLSGRDFLQNFHP
jgi:hypothetical protein